MSAFPFVPGQGLILAPMAGVTDRTMRRLCGEMGADQTVTEMLSAKALVYEQLSRPSAPIKTADLCILDEAEGPAAVQLFGSEPEVIAQAARLISLGTYRGFRGRRACAVDINMGCPVRKVVGCGEGSALMRDPEKIYEIVRAAAEASVVPVTVKMRAGWDAEHKNAVECAKAAEAGGAAAVCVHARTREQFYAPGTDWNVIGEVKAAVSIPVIGNGDVDGAESALRMLRVTGCDGVAVARAAMGRPWIFSEIRAALRGDQFVPPEPAQILEIALRHLKMTAADKGERRGTAEVKVTISKYVSGLRGAAAARTRIMDAASVAQIEQVLTGFFTDTEQ